MYPNATYPRDSRDFRPSGSVAFRASDRPYRATIARRSDPTAPARFAAREAVRLAEIRAARAAREDAR